MAGESLFASLVVVTIVNGAGLVIILLGGAGCTMLPLGFGFEGFLIVAGGVVTSPSSSGMVGQYVFSTCLRAGRRMGFERKKSMPESRHSFTLLSSA